AFDMADWSFWMPPIRTRRPVPPLRKVLRVHRSRGGLEDQRAGDQLLLRRRGRPRRGLAHNLFQGGWLFGRGDVAGRLDEGPELGVGDFGCVHPEAIHADAV